MQTVLHEGKGDQGAIGGGPEQTILPGSTPIEEGAEEDLKAMRMLGGEMRWLDMSSSKDQLRILVEERRLEDKLHAGRDRGMKCSPRYEVEHEVEVELKTKEDAVQPLDDDDELEEYLARVVEGLKDLSLEEKGRKKRYRESGGWS